MNETAAPRPTTPKPALATPPASETSMGDSQDRPTTPPISEGSVYSGSNTTPKSNKPKEVIVNFRWAQYLAPYDELAAANFELPRVPQFSIDLEKGTIHKITSQHSNSQDDDYRDVMVIDREARQAMEEARKLESVQELLRRVGIAKAPVRRTIQRKKL